MFSTNFNPTDINVFANVIRLFPTEADPKNIMNTWLLAIAEQDEEIKEKLPASPTVDEVITVCEKQNKHNTIARLARYFADEGEIIEKVLPIWKERNGDDTNMVRCLRLFLPDHDWKKLTSTSESIVDLVDTLIRFIMTHKDFAELNSENNLAFCDTD